MEHVHHHGWTNSAIVAGARDIGLSPAVSGEPQRACIFTPAPCLPLPAPAVLRQSSPGTAGILTNGEGDLVAYFVDRCNGELADRLAEMQDDLREMRVRDRIKTAVRIRLELTLPYINSWSQVTPRIRV